MATNQDGPQLNHYNSNPGLLRISASTNRSSSFEKKVPRQRHGELILPIFHLRDLEKGVQFVNRLSEIRSMVLTDSPLSGQNVAMEFGGLIHQLDVLSQSVSKVIMIFEEDIILDREWTNHPKHQFKLTLDLFVVVEGRERMLTGFKRFLAFRIERGFVEIRRLSIVNCGHLKAREGGAVRVAGDSHVFLKKITCVGCKAKCGPIWIAPEGHLKIKSSIFLSCSSLEHGGAVYNQGYTQLQGCTFSKTITNGCGGAVYNAAGGSCQVASCEFRNCVASKSGGAFFNSNGALVLLEDNNYEANRTATKSGKAASFEQGV